MTTWNEQSKQWFDAWAGAQQSLWQSWQQAAGAAGSSATDPFGFWTQWQKMASDGMAAYGKTMTQMMGGESWETFASQWENWLGSAAPMSAGAPLRALEEALTPWLESPPLGITREMERKLRQLFQANLALQRATAEYQSVLGDAWLNVGQQLQQAMLDGDRDPIESMADMAGLWSEIADPAFLDIFRSERYIRAQGALLEATMQVRIRQRAVTETMSEFLDMPTRTEVDAAHKINYEQRKQIKALQKALAATETRLEALEKKPARRTRRKKAEPAAPATEEA